MEYNLKKKNNSRWKISFTNHKIYYIYQIFNFKKHIWTIYEQALPKIFLNYFRVSVKNSLKFFSKTPFKLFSKMSRGSILVTELSEEASFKDNNKNSVLLSDLICIICYDNYYFENQIRKIKPFNYIYSNKLLVFSFKKLVKNFYYKLSK